MAYRGILQTKTGYALALTTFTEAELKKILQRAVDIAYKSKIGLNRNFPSAVLQSQNDFCGLAHPPFYTQQGFKQLHMLLGTIRNKGNTGDYIKASLELEQQESGYTIPILSKHPSHIKDWPLKHGRDQSKDFSTQCRRRLNSITSGVQQNSELMTFY